MTPQPRPLRSARLRTLLGFAFTFVFALALHAASATKSFNIPAGDAAVTLKLFSEQSGLAIMFAPEKVQGVETKAVAGELTPQEALDRLLADTRLYATPTKQAGGYSIRRENAAESKNANRAIAENSVRPEKSDSRYETDANGEKVLKLDTFEVFGRKSLNMDIRRTRDDSQPYVIFERETIESSGATDLNTFLKDRLSMNTQASTGSQQANSLGNTSAVNLRGLGTSQTLILIDGHRTASRASSGLLGQANINGIPLAAIERVEVLAAAASGIYGGNATGGVINVVLRRDYVGAEIGLKYDNSFDTDSAIRRVDFSAGLGLENGKTNILLAGSWTDNNEMWEQDRGLVARARARILANNPTSTVFFATTPPMGSTPNIRSVDGSPLFGAGTPNFTSVPHGYAGGGGLAPLQLNAGKYNLELADSAQPANAGGNQRRVGLTGLNEQSSLSATVRRQFAPFLEIFVDSSYSKQDGMFRNAFGSGIFSYTVQATAPNNPFGKAISVRVPTDALDGYFATHNNRARVVSGAIVQLPFNWKTELDYTWDRYRAWNEAPRVLSAAGTAAISNGTVDVLRDTSRFPLDLTPYIVRGGFSTPSTMVLKDAAWRAAGPTFQTGAGSIMLSALLESRDEVLKDSFDYTATGTINWSPRSTAKVQSAYLEASIPVVSRVNARTGVQELELQLAGRYDKYKLNAATPSLAFTPTSVPVRTTGSDSSENPTIGLRYRPFEALMFRASYGTGFLPPSVDQLVPGSPQNFAGTLFPQTATDPKRGNEAVTQVVSRLSGGNPNLRPELSESFTFGLVFTPRQLAGFRLSIDYVKLEKTDAFGSPGNIDLTTFERLFPERVTRSAPVPGDPFPVGKITAIDTTLVNLSRATIEAVDVAVDYERKVGAHTLSGFMSGTWQPHYVSRFFEGERDVEYAGVALAPIGIASSIPAVWKGTIGATVASRGWKSGWVARYVHGYWLSATHAVDVNQGSARVASQIYHDWFLNFSVQKLFRLRPRKVTDRAEIQLGVNNIFNAMPPFDVSRTGTYYSALGDPRGSSYYISLKKAF
jgi:iron complex outermembrane receptor protein